MKLLQLVLPILACVLLANCRSSGVGQVMRNGLPAFARVIVVETEIEEAELSRRVLAKLEEAGFQCSGSRLIRTAPLKSGTLWTRATVEIEGSVASASSEWALPDTALPETASRETASRDAALPDDRGLFWRVARNAEGSAEEVFLDLCRGMKEIPHVEVSYRFE